MIMEESAIFSAFRTFSKACRTEGKRMVICFADRNGDPIFLYRAPEAWLGSIDVAQNKAWTAVAFSGPTEEEALTTEKIAELTQPGESPYGLQNTNQGRVVIFGGGIPIYVDNQLVGSVGVSGATVDVDIKLAQVAVEAYISSI